MLKKVLGLVLVGVLCLTPVAFADSNTAVSKTQSDANAGALIDQSGQDNRVKSINRNLPVPGNVPIPGTNGFFTVPTPDSSYRNIIEVLRFAGPIFSEGALEKMKSGADLDSHFQPFNFGNVKRAKALDMDGKKVRYIKIVVDHNGNLDKEGEVRYFAAVDAEADDAETNSIQVMANMGDACAEKGGNIMVITNQGAHRIVEASGWGIGFYTVGSQVSDGGQTAGLVGGGTGYAQNEAGPEDRPWLHGYCGVRANPVIPDLDRAGLPNK